MTATKNAKKAALITGAAVLVGALLYTVLVPRPVLVEIARVERKAFRETLQSDGVLRSKERHIVPAFADGDIRRVDLKVGDTVRKGQAVAELFWDVKYRPVRSPIDGVVSKVFRESAGPIRRGDPIVEVIDPARLEVVAELLTTDAARVSAGDPAEIGSWGGEPPLKARVSRVSRAGFTKQSALGVEEERTEVTMALEDVPDSVLSRLGSTFHVDVAIEISSVPDALVIPEGALFRDGPDWAAYVVRDGRAAKAALKPSARGGGLAMIGNDLREGEEVIVFPGDLVREGVRVRSRQ